MRFDALLTAAHDDALALLEDPVVTDLHEPQQVPRNHQAPIDCFAIFAEPRPDIHRVAEKRQLALGVAAFADDNGAGVQPRPEGWR
jgi:hypothetical protein